MFIVSHALDHMYNLNCYFRRKEHVGIESPHLFANAELSLGLPTFTEITKKSRYGRSIEPLLWTGGIEPSYAGFQYYDSAMTRVGFFTFLMHLIALEIL